jgi:SAM-dependent methyltransferase
MSDPTSDRIRANYDAGVEREWNRLVLDAYRGLEFNLTWEALTRLLPARSRVLDAGGGPGRYSLALARAGFDVHLVDLSPAQVQFVRERFSEEPAEVQARLLGCETADLRDLSRFTPGSFDAAVCLGAPLTHIPEAVDRVQAVREMTRVVRPGGWLFLTGVGRLAVLRWMLNFSSEELLTTDFERFLQDGMLFGPGEMLWHFFRADELRQLAESCGLETIEMRGCQGLSSGLIDSTNRIAETQPEMWRVWQDLLLRTANEPAVVDGAEHILWIGKKPD